MNLLKGAYLNKNDYEVKECSLEEVREICKNKHYLHRVPSIVAYYGFIQARIVIRSCYFWDTAKSIFNENMW